MPGFILYLSEKVTKYPNFHDFCPKNARILPNDCPKKIFPIFFGRGARPPRPPSPTPMRWSIKQYAIEFHNSNCIERCKILTFFQRMHTEQFCNKVVVLDPAISQMRRYFNWWNVSVNISQGNVTKCFKCSGTFSHYFIASKFTADCRVCQWRNVVGLNLSLFDAEWRLKPTILDQCRLQTSINKQKTIIQP